MGLNDLGAPGAPGGRGNVKVYPGPLSDTEIPDVGDCSRSLCAGDLGETVKGAASTGSRSTTSWLMAATATSSEGASWASVAGGSHKKVATTTNKTADLVRDCFIVVFSLVKGFII
jgi:hypothetical protein